MSNKLTAEEYLNELLSEGVVVDGDTITEISESKAEHYGDLRAKEAVEKFAREC